MGVTWLLEQSAVITHLRRLKTSPICIFALIVDVLLGTALWNIISDLDMMPVWQQLSQLISHIDKVISWLMSDPVGLKLNEPVNLALASFFRYHIYLWHTFVQFLYAPVLLHTVTISFFGGFSFAVALCTDLIAVFTLHIHCFYVYASR